MSGMEIEDFDLGVHIFAFRVLYVKVLTPNHNFWGSVPKVGSCGLTDSP